MNRRLLAEGTVFGILLVVLRLGLLAGIGYVAGGQEFTGDAAFQRLFVDDPLVVLLSHPVEFDFIHAYPPLQPVLVWAAVALPAAWCSSFYALRLGFLVFELLAWPFLWSLIVGRSATVAERRWLACACLATPMAWMTDVVMCQDETIGLLLTASMVWLLVRDRPAAAACVAGCGVVASKVFFAVPLAALVLLPPGHGRASMRRRAAAGLVPIVVGYSLPVAVWWWAGTGVPLARLTFDGLHSTTLWALVSLAKGGAAQGTIKTLSTALALAAAAVVLALARRDPPEAPAVRLVGPATLMLLAVFVCFYVVPPEYYLLLVPGLIVLMPPQTAVWVVSLVLTLPWSINFFYGVWWAEHGGKPTGKGAFLELYRALFPFDPVVLHVAAIVAWGVAGLLLVAALARRVFTRSSPT